MMKQLLYTFLLLSFLKSDGQTFDSTWFPRPGVSYTMFDSFDEGVADFPTPEFGLDQEWDFSELSRTPFASSIRYIDPNEASFQDSFPNADVVKEEDDEYGTWEWYFRTSNDTLYQEGFALVDKFFELDTFFTIHQPNEIIYAYAGFSLGDTSLILGDNSRFLHFFGTGTVVTRVDTYENCVMMKVESPGAGTGAFEFKWYYKNLMNAVLSFVPEESDHPFAGVSWSGNYLDPLSSTEGTEYSTDETPSYNIDYADGFLNIYNFGNQAEVQVYTYDLQGRLLSQPEYRLANGANQLVHPELSNAGIGCYPTIIVEKRTKAFSTYKVMKNYK